MDRKTSSIGITENSWQVLGQLEITVGSETELGPWLAGVISELNLREDFQDKVVQSAHEGVSKAIQAMIVRRREHLHLFIFVPTSRALNNHNWGFYRIEKVENMTGNAKPDHSIELYLYQDGK